MEFSHRVPKILIDLYLRRLDKKHLTRSKVIGFSEDDHAEDDRKTALLGRMLKSIEMKSTWATLRKRVSTEDEYLQFWWYCEHIERKWKNHKKLTPKEREKKIKKIIETIELLRKSLTEVNGFSEVQLSSFLVPPSYEYMSGYLGDDNFLHGIDDPEKAVFPWIEFEKEEAETVAALVDEYLGSPDYILFQLRKFAERSLQEEYSVKKPNSPKANIHFFIRELSRYLVHNYGQPLHHVAAVTTSVIFEETIDDDFVRKLVT